MRCLCSLTIHEKCESCSIRIGLHPHVESRLVEATVYVLKSAKGKRPVKMMLRLCRDCFAKAVIEEKPLILSSEEEWSSVFQAEKRK